MIYHDIKGSQFRFQFEQGERLPDSSVSIGPVASKRIPANFKPRADEMVIYEDSETEFILLAEQMDKVMEGMSLK